MEKNILISGSMIYGGLPGSLKKGFEGIGWQVHGFDDQLIFNEQNRWSNRYVNRLCWRLTAKAVQQRLIQAVEALRPSVLLVLKGFYFSPETITRVKKASPSTVLIYFNPDNSFNTWHFGNSNDWIRNSVHLYDIHFTWGKFLIPELRAAGAKAVFYLPFACDPDLHHPVALGQEDISEYGSDVAFVGSWDKEREGWLSHLLDYRLKIWGNAWQKASPVIREKWQQKEMVGDKFSKVCCASKINLNFIRKQNIPAHNMRTFEIPACGGFMLSTRTSEQGSIWTEGHEIACFSTPHELRQMVEQYLKSTRKRETMALRANKKALSYFTYKVRAEEIENFIEIPNSRLG